LGVRVGMGCAHPHSHNSLRIAIDLVRVDPNFG
jgi:hypothetical protein